MCGVLIVAKLILTCSIIKIGTCFTYVTSAKDPLKRRQPLVRIVSSRVIFIEDEMAGLMYHPMCPSLKLSI